jgi:hypothetical protein
VAHTGGRGIHIACGTYGEEIHIVFWLGNLKEQDHLEDLGADGRIILKLISQKYYRMV